MCQYFFFSCLNIYIFASLVEVSVHLGGKVAFKLMLVKLFCETEREYI